MIVKKGWCVWGACLRTIDLCINENIVMGHEKLGHTLARLLFILTWFISLSKGCQNNA